MNIYLKLIIIDSQKENFSIFNQIYKYAIVP